MPKVGHKDTGCGLFPSCLNCPLPVCKEDRIKEVVRRKYHLRPGRRTNRDKEMIKLKEEEGKTQREIAKILEINESVVSRRFKKMREASQEE